MPDPAEPLPGRHPVRFGTAELIADLDRPRGWMLAVDGVFQSYVDLDDPTYLDFGYLHHVGRVLDLVAPPGAPVDAVHLGVGAGTLVRYLASTRPGSRHVVVDADGPLLDLALGTLGLGRVPGVVPQCQDARDAVAAQPDDSADVVVLDVFAGGAVPVHVTTAEFAADVARVLRTGGVCVANLADSGALAFARAQAATWRAALGSVVLLAEPAVLRGRRYGNLVLACSRHPLPVEPLVRAVAPAPFPARVLHGEALDGFVGDAVPATDAVAVAPPSPPAGTVGDALSG
ncbi:MAG: spermidine synthase [Actinomycetes bacterium]